MSKQTVISSHYDVTDKDTGALVSSFEIRIINNRYCLFDATGNIIKDQGVIYPPGNLEVDVVRFAEEHNANITRQRIKTQKSESVFDFSLNAFITTVEEYTRTW